MSSSYDAIVIGLGVMGAAACAALARRGARVLGLEQHALGHGLGSSGGGTRLVRKAYFEHADYVPLLHRAYELWDELGERNGAALLHRTGLVCAGPPEGELVAGTLRAAALHALPIERVASAEARRRFPELALPERFDVLFDPDGGFVAAESAVMALARDAERHGATLETGRRVSDIRATGDGFRVRVGDIEHACKRVVTTAGPWTSALLAKTGPLVSLRVTRQVLGWVSPKEPERFALGRFPCWAVEDDAQGFAGLYYGFPIPTEAESHGPRGLKVAHHFPGEEADPDTVDREFHPADEAGFRAALERFVPSGRGPLLAGHVCLYTSSPDAHFIVDHHPAHKGWALACGFSGHGFKFAPVIGEALADLVLEGRTELPIGFLSLGRFA